MSPRAMLVQMFPNAYRLIIIDTATVTMAAWDKALAAKAAYRATLTSKWSAL